MELNLGQELDSVNSEDQEVFTYTLRIESKIFYLDLKENQRGRYLKLSEKRANRPRSTVIVPSSGLKWFTKVVLHYIDATDTRLLSKELAVENKVFYFSTGENARGRFLRIAESGGGPAGRSSIIIPSAGRDGRGWVEFRQAMIDMYAAESAITLEPLPDNVDPNQVILGPGPSSPTLTNSNDGALMLRVGQKRFYFDSGSNHRGHYIRITEVVGSERNSVIVPLVAVSKFQEAIMRLVDLTPHSDLPDGL